MCVTMMAKLRDISIPVNEKQQSVNKHAGFMFIGNNK